MRKRFISSAIASLEWRAIAFIITGLVLWVMTGHLGKATLAAVSLQVILFIAHMIWFYYRHTK